MKRPEFDSRGRFLFLSRNTSNNSELFQYQFEHFLSLLKMAATVYERENCDSNSENGLMDD